MRANFRYRESVILKKTGHLRIDMWGRGLYTYIVGASLKTSEVERAGNLNTVLERSKEERLPDFVKFIRA